MSDVFERDQSALDLLDTWRDESERRLGVTPLRDVSVLEHALDLTHAHPTGWAKLFASGSVQLDSLFREASALTGAERSLRKVLDAKSRFDRDEGFSALTLVSGIARWNGNNVPVMLYRVDVTLPDDDMSHAVISLRSQAEINPQLVAALEADGLSLDVEGILESAKYADGSIDSVAAVTRIQTLGERHIEGFELVRDSLIGCLVLPGSIVLEQTDSITERIHTGPTGNMLLDALVGNPDSVKAIRSNPVGEFSPFDLDPHDEVEVADPDNKTRYAARMVTHGASVFIDTPSGADTTAMAVAIASRAILNGKTVMVVPGVASLRKRFVSIAKDNEIGGMVIDLTDPARNSVIDVQLINAVGYQSGTASSRFDQLADELVGVRSRLARYLGDLHGRNDEWGVSAYETIENLARISALPTKPATRIRLSADTARTLAGHLAEWGDRLVAAGKLGEFTIGPDDTSWFNASLYTEREAIEAYNRVVRLLDELLPRVREQIRSSVEVCGFPIPACADDWGDQVTVFKNLRRVLDVFKPAIFERDITVMLEATKSKEERKADRKAGKSKMGFWERRRHVKEARSLLRAGSHVDDLHEALEVVARQADQWRQFVPHGGWPVLPPKLDEIIETLDALTADLTALEMTLATTPDGAGLAAMPFVNLEQRLRRLYDDHQSLDTLPQRMVLERDFQKAGLSDLVADMRRRGIAIDAAPDELQLAWWTTVFELIVHASPIISNQDGSVLSSAADRFGQIDTEHVRSAGAMIGQELTKRLSELLFSRTHDANQLHSMLTASQPLSMSYLLKEYPEITMAAKPLIVSSVAGACAALPLRTVVDVAIIDAGAHMDSAQLLPILARARQVVVLAHKETISSPLVKTLSRLLIQVRAGGRPTHRDPRLATFLRSHGYGRIDMAVPVAVPADALRFHLVESEGVPTPGTGLVETSKQEVSLVADLVAARQKESSIVPMSYCLAVVCPTTVHRDRVEDELRVRGARDAGFRKFLRHVRVIELDRVCGVRADDAIISLGFTKTVHGRLLQQFGPLEAKGADRQLLDALACAEDRVDIVSSFTAESMEDERVRQPGPRLLKELLTFAEQLTQGLIARPEPTAHDDAQDVLMADLAARIRARGLEVAIGYGYGEGMRIPMAVAAKGKPYALAILTDDTMFMSVASTRRRHRFDPDDLRMLGWETMQVWSVAAFVNPEKEVDRIVARLASIYGER